MGFRAACGTQGVRAMSTKLPVPSNHGLFGRRVPAVASGLRPVSLAVALLGVAPLAWALPEGATTVQGQAVVKPAGAGRLEIQQGTARAAIDWTRFAIGANEQVVIHQPGRDAVLVNRVLGSDPSLIFGSLRANGTVWLVNPRGIVFGRDSQMDVGGLLASTLGIRNEDLASGRLLLTRGDGQAGALRAEGRISAPDGSVVLVAPSLLQSGSIDARRIGLAAATEVQVDVEGDGLVFFNARNDGSLETRLQQLGSLRADGGLAELRAAARADFADTVLNLEGVVQARSIGRRAGRIVIDGGDSGSTRLAGLVDASGQAGGAPGGQISVAGAAVVLEAGARVDASGAAGGGTVRLAADHQQAGGDLVLHGSVAARGLGAGAVGGQIDASGQRVGLFDAALLDASGRAGGGQLRVGGDYLGQGDLPRSQRTVVGPSARLLANAIDRGDGGRVILWSDGETLFNGSIGAAGGAAGGQGGFVETSGKRGLGIDLGQVDFGVRGGGQWLLDPTDLTVNEAGANSSLGSLNGFNATGSLNIRPSTLQAANANITLQATNSITFQSALTLGGSFSLTVQTNGGFADPATTGTIAINANISTNGAISLQEQSGGGSITQQAGTTVNAGSGTISINGGGGTVSLAGALTTTNGTAQAIGISAATDLQIGALTTGAGGIVNLTFSGNGTQSGGGITANQLVKAGAGTLTLSRSDNSLNSTSVNGGMLAISGAAATAGSGSILVGANRLDILNGASVANTVTVSTGSIRNTAGSGTLAGGLALGGNAQLAVAGTGTGLTVSGVVSETVAGSGLGTSGAVTLTANNSYSGNTAVASGTLVLDGPGADAGSGTVVVGANVLDLRNGASVTGAVTLGATGTLRNSAGSAEIAASGSLQLGGAANLQSTGTGLAVRGVVSQTVASAVTTSGAVTLANANSYSGGTTVASGTLSIDASSVAGANAGSGAITLGANRLDIVGGASVGNALGVASGAHISSSAGGGTLAVGAGGGATLALPSGPSTLDLSGGATQALVVARPLLDDATGLQAVRVVSGVVTLSGPNTHDGGTSVNAGTLRLASNTGAGTGVITLNGNTLDIVGGASVGNALSVASGATIRSSTGGGTLAVGAGDGATLALPGGASTLALAGGAADALVVARPLLGNAAGLQGLSVVAGLVELTGPNTHDGGTTVSGGGRLRIAGDAALGSGGLTLDNGTLLSATAFSSTRALSLGAAGGTVDTSAGNLVLGGTVSGEGRLSKAGNGTLTLTADNGHTGGTAVDGGTLVLDGANADAGSGSIVLGANTLDLRNGARSAGNVTVSTGSIRNTAGSGTLAGGLALGGNAQLAVAGTGTGLTVSGVVSETVAGSGLGTSGAVTLTANNSYSGNTAVASGTLVLDGPGADAGSGTVVVGANVLDLRNGASSAGAVTVTTGSITNSAGSGRLAGGLALGGDAQLAVTGTGTGLTVAGVVSETLAGRRLTTSGAVTLANANTYSGGTTVAGGTLAIDGSSVAGANAGSGAITLGAHTLDLRNGASSSTAVVVTTGSITNSAGSGTLAGGLSLAGDAQLSVRGTGTGLTIAGVVSEMVAGSGLSTSSSAGTAVTLANQNSHTGTTTIDSGTLAISGPASDAGSGRIVVGANRLDIIRGASVANAVTVAHNGQISSSVGGGTLAAGAGDGATLALPNGASTLRLSGSAGDALVVARPLLNHPAGLQRVEVQAGVVTLSGANTHDGGTSVSAGTLRLASDTGAGSGTISLGSHTLDIVDGASVANLLTVANGATVGNSSGTGTLAAHAAGLTLAANTGLTLSSTGDGLVLARAIEAAPADAATASLAITGAGAGVQLLVASTHGGGTTVSGGGTLRIADQAPLGSGSLALAGGTLAATAPFNTTRAISLGAGGGTVHTSAGDVRLAGVVAGTGPLTKTGTGTLTLAADNAYSGGTTVADGTLALDGPGADAGSGTLALGSHTLDLRNGARVSAALALGPNATLRNSAGAGEVAASGALLLGGDANLEVTGTGTGLVVRGLVSETVAGSGLHTSGAVTLAADNSHSGPTTVNSGTLTLDGPGADAGSGAILVGANRLNLVNGASVGGQVRIGGGSLANTVGSGEIGPTGALLVDGLATLEVTGAGLLLRGPVSETQANSGLAIVGGGTVTLATANSHSGATTVADGTLVIRGAGANAGTGAIVLGANVLDLVDGASLTQVLTVADGATLANSSGSGVLAFGGTPLSLPDGATLQLHSSGTGLSVDREISDGAGTAALRVSGAGGLVVLGRDNSFGGGLTVSGGGILALASTGALGAGPLQLDNGSLRSTVALDTNLPFTLGAGGGTLDTGVFDVVLGGQIGGSGALTKSGSGTLSLQGNSSYSGGTTVADGVLAISGATARAGSGAIVVGDKVLDLRNGASVANAVGMGSGGMLRNSAGAGEIGPAGSLQLDGDATLAVTGTGSGLGLRGVVNERRPSALTVDGGTVTLAHDNSYSGGTTVASGTLRIDAQAVAAAGAGSGPIQVGANRLDLVNGAVLAQAVTLAGGTLANGAGAGTLAGPLTLAGGGQLGSTGSGLLVSGAILGAGGIAVQAGTVSLSNASNSYDGGTAVNAGSLRLLGGAAVPDGSALALSGTASLVLVDSEVLGSISGSDATRISLGSNTLTVGGDGTSTGFAGVIDGAAGGGLVKLGAGVLTLSGSHAHLGSTTLAAGGLVLAGAAERLHDSSRLVVTGGTLDMGGLQETVAGVQQTGGLIRNGTLVSASHFDMQAGTTSAVLAGTHPGVGLDKTGAGALTLAGNNSYQGSTTLNAGALVLAQPGEHLADGSRLVVHGGSLDIGSHSETVGALSLQGGASVLGSTGVLTSRSAFDLQRGSVAAILGGSAGATKRGPDSVSLAAVNQYTGLTAVEAGTLLLTGPQRLASSGTASVAAGATLSLAGAQTLARLDLAGRLAGTGPLDTPDFRSTTGRIDLPLTVATLDISGESEINAEATVGSIRVLAGGQLVVGADGRLINTNTLSVAPTATLRLVGAQSVGAFTLGGTLDGAGMLTATSYALQGGQVLAALGGGALSSTGDSLLDAAAAVTSLSVLGGSFSTGAQANLSALPAVQVDAGATWALAGSQRIGSLAGAGQVALDRHTLRSGAGGSSRFDGVIGGSGGLVKEGGGSFSLDGDNGFSGGTVVAAGTLALLGRDRLADAGAVQVEAGATLTLDASDRVATLQLAGTLAGSGTLTAAQYQLQGGTVLAGLGRGALTSEGVSRLAGAAAVDSISVLGGQLQLAAGAPTAAPVTSVAAGASLALAGDATLGSLDGAGTVELGSATLRTGVAGSSRFSGVIEGSGGLVKQGDASFSLAGANRYTGPTTVGQGSLLLAGDDRLAAGTAVTVAPGAVLSLAGDNSVASLVLQGTLDGSGTLRAATYALEGGRALADLGPGQLLASGSSHLAGRSAAAQVQVLDGQLSLAGPQRLADGASVGVAAGARLTLAGEQQIDSLVLQGTLDGSGPLRTRLAALDSGRVEADLAADSLSSRGASQLLGQATAGTVDLLDGSLSLAGANRLPGLPALSLQPGARLLLGGDHSLGSLSGDGSVELGGFTLDTGARGSSSFAGVISGSGGLVKRGSDTRFTLTGSNTYTGSTWVAEGTLALGDGGSSGALATSAFVVDGVLQSRRADNVRLDQPISGSGALEQHGSLADSTLSLQGSNRTHTGATRVQSGRLRTIGDEALSDSSALEVAPGASLVLGGAETVRAVLAQGTVDIASRLTTTGAMVLEGAARAAGAAPLRLEAESIDALHAGNRWGPGLSISTSGAVRLAAGSDSAGRLPLTLGAVQVGGGGRIESSTLALNGLTSLRGGTLVLDVDRGEVVIEPGGALLGTLTPANRQIALTQDVLTQGSDGRIEVAAGGRLDVRASRGGSVALQHDGNRFEGNGLSVVVGAENQPWTANLPATPGTGDYSVQNRVRVHGLQVDVGGAGIQADVVEIQAGGVRTLADSSIVAKLPYDNLVGTTQSLPALSFTLTDLAFDTAGSYGQAGAGIRISVGSRLFGPRTALPLDSGYVTVLPPGGARGSTALQLLGPNVGAYSFFYGGAGQLGEIPVFYNGVSAVTPQVSGSISSTLSVSEGARKERFEEAVRTENVALRLRAGVIAEVGPGTPATVNATSMERMRPPSCTPAPGSLACP